MIKASYRISRNLNVLIREMGLTTPPQEDCEDGVLKGEARAPRSVGEESTCLPLSLPFSLPFSSSVLLNPIPYLFF